MNNNLLPFRNVAYWKQLNEINKLDTSKPTQSEGIPFKIKKIILIFLLILILIYKRLTNASKAELPDQLKKTEVFLKKIIKPTIYC